MRHFIKARMSSYATKGKVIKAARTVKAEFSDLNLSKKTGLKFKNETALPSNYQESPIFINEAVSRSTRMLLSAAIKLKKEK